MKRPKTVEEFHEKATVSVCSCFAKNKKKVLKMTAHWELFSAGVDLNSGIQVLDLVCLGCGACRRIVYGRRNGR
jgi:hypothetical protein